MNLDDNILNVGRKLDLIVYTYTFPTWRAYADDRNNEERKFPIDLSHRTLDLFFYP